MVAPGEGPYRDGDGASGSEDSDGAMDLLAREDDRVLTVRIEEELHSLNVGGIVVEFTGKVDAESCMYRGAEFHGCRARAARGSTGLA